MKKIQLGTQNIFFQTVFDTCCLCWDRSVWTVSIWWSDSTQRTYIMPRAHIQDRSLTIQILQKDQSSLVQHGARYDLMILWGVSFLTIEITVWCGLFKWRVKCIYNNKWHFTGIFIFIPKTVPKEWYHDIITGRGENQSLSSKFDRAQLPEQISQCVTSFPWLTHVRDIMIFFYQIKKIVQFLF